MLLPVWAFFDRMFGDLEIQSDIVPKRRAAIADPPIEREGTLDFKTRSPLFVFAPH
jgi:hypothetical protein